MDKGKENAKKSSPKYPEGNSKQACEGSLKDSAASAKGSHAGERSQGEFVPVPWNPEMVGFPWDFKEKWPITRAERLRELEILSIHYETTHKKDNIIAVKAWHGQFPPEQIIPDEEVIFQGGQIVKEEELEDKGGVTWEEGPPEDVFMTGHGAGSSEGLPPPVPQLTSRGIPSLHITPEQPIATCIRFDHPNSCPNFA